jgi:hypothetical protein
MYPMKRGAKKGIKEGENGGGAGLLSTLMTRQERMKKSMA